MPDRLYTLRDAAQRYNCTRVAILARLKRLRADGHDIGRLVGVQWLLTAADVEQLRPGPEGRPAKKTP